MASERDYTAKENARFELMSAMERYLAAADKYDMGAQETADELTDVFINSGQPYKVETT